MRQPEQRRSSPALPQVPDTRKPERDEPAEGEYAQMAGTTAITSTKGQKSTCRNS